LGVARPDFKRVNFDNIEAAGHAKIRGSQLGAASQRAEGG
jgi:hypothetical protein